ncbi:MAG: hypothetical protein M9928_01060 [Anaerolineae bacterium]|nr:hypothetical protein [Anaerolineae bacterium]MCO5190196.1 hypothetical protein [Anaerolineae bacterium]MCO5192545.1 hypothetical protein [Anaerolineae bacterium]MCO5198729.1 hypothetical protein [Anaerolineae bacterium]MCO5203599.1 hypothetical protein [Anaerolineae bacterium]
MVLLQAAEGDFIANPGLLGILIIAGAILAFYWYRTHCPNCKRIFTRETIKKEKAGLLPTAISGKERRHYRCKHCGNEWEATHYVE